MEEIAYRPTWAEIDLRMIEHNIQQIKQNIASDCGIIAVVKADAYGHGSIQVAKTALRAGAKGLAVALLEEAIQLRQADIKAPILVLGWVAPEDVSIAADNDITLTFFQKAWLQEVNKQTFHHKLKLHMKWDTGMGRIGIRTTEELREIIGELNKNMSIKLTGVFTHFSTADDEDITYFRKQNNRFNELKALFATLWPYPVDFHTGNSAASIRFPEEMHNYIRFGISMYGLYPSKIVKFENRIQLKEAFSLHSRLIHVKKVPPGQSISYGRTYETKQVEWIGTIPIGYADGWSRKLQGADVLVDGKRMPIVGRVCMDQTMIRLDKNYEIGTKVTLIGKQKNNRIEVDEVADKLGTINYEVPCMISKRVPRVYIAE